MTTHKGYLVLNGGDAFAPECRDAHRDWLRLLRRDGSRPHLVVVPTAEMKRPQKMADKAMRYFKNLGTFAEYTLIQNTTSANTETDFDVINKMEAVVLLDGSPVDLVERLHGTKADKALHAVLERSAALTGIGAGAMALGALLWFGGGWERALGIMPDLAFLPRHEHMRMRFDPARLLHDLPDGVTLIGLDATAFLTRYPNGEFSVSGLGAVTVYVRPDRAIDFRAGQTFALPLDPELIAAADAGESTPPAE